MKDKLESPLGSEYAKNELNMIREYEQKGYTASYKCENGKLQDLETGKSYSPEEIYIKEEYRYEGMSNPSDLSILYIVETKDDSKGTVLVPYGPAADTGLAEFFKEVPKNNLSKREDPAHDTKA